MSEMKYKGYQAKVEYDDDDAAFTGLVQNVRDTIHFEGASVEELRAAFEESVDFYLDACARDGVEPATPYSGRFVIRVSSELHGRLSETAHQAGKSLNAFVSEALHRSVQSGDE